VAEEEQDMLRHLLLVVEAEELEVIEPLVLDQHLFKEQLLMQPKE